MAMLVALCLLAPLASAARPTTLEPYVELSATDLIGATTTYALPNALVPHVEYEIRVSWPAAVPFEPRVEWSSPASAGARGGLRRRLNANKLEFRAGADGAPPGTSVAVTCDRFGALQPVGASGAATEVRYNIMLAKTPLESIKGGAGGAEFGVWASLGALILVALLATRRFVAHVIR